MINPFKSAIPNNKDKTKVIDFPSIGNITLERSKRAKYMNISIKSTAKIRVAVPIGISFNEAELFARSKTEWIQKKIIKISKSKNILKEVNMDQARFQLKERIDFLSEKHNFKYNKLFIKNQKTRWGSCSGENNINLNAKLLNLPQKLIDYVILHELVHTKVKNHSSEFWFTLESYMDDSKKYDKELKKYSL
jgi:predicted metal-dependent hydrolase|tara:strand:+ start:3342 stop:3917 length:576 start_codon:yes stop_codon:yes gene_type:complete